MLYEPSMAKSLEAEIQNMTQLLFLPGDITQLKSTIRRILVDLTEVGYRRDQPILKYETIETISKIVTRAIALQKLASVGPVNQKTDRRIVWQSSQVDD